MNAVVRRTYTCAEKRSNHLRTGAEVDLLVQHGSVARVFELQGELFVGTAERDEPVLWPLSRGTHAISVYDAAGHTAETTVVVR